jgi:hypothetical protein
MNAIADRLAPRRVGSVFIYTHEAHPGEHYPHHASFEQKLVHARALREQLGVTRTILVDALDGACHRAFGSMPNMSWILSRAGQPVYKSDWTDARSVERAVEYFLEVSDRRRSGERLVGFRVERVDYRTRDPQAFRLGLERSGPKAVEEFYRTFGSTES